MFANEQIKQMIDFFKTVETQIFVDGIFWNTLFYVINGNNNYNNNIFISV